MSDISDRLKSAIKLSGLSQRELEIRTGIPHSAIQRYAAGDTQQIPITRIQQLANALGVTAEYILGWDNEKSATNDDDGREREFVELFRQLSDEQKSLVIASIKGILSNQ